MSSPITLAATGLPNLAKASFNPPSVHPARPQTPSPSPSPLPTPLQPTPGHSAYLSFWRSCYPPSHSSPFSRVTAAKQSS
jgi:hypothetical protein